MRVCQQLMMMVCSGSACVSMVFAAPPPALDRVPADAPVTIVISNLQEFLNETKSFGRSILPPDQVLQMNMGLALAQTFLDMPGMNANGSAVAVIHTNDQDAFFGPPIVVVLPVTDFKQVREALGATGTGTVLEADINNNPVYMRDLGGGFMAVGPFAELVQEFSGTAGNLGTHTSMLGRNGERVLADSDFTVIVNLEQMAPQIREGAEQMRQQMDMVMMMAGDQAAQMRPMLDMMNGAMTALANDGKAFAFGAQMDTSGLTFHTGLNFKDGSGGAAFFSNAGSTGTMLDKVPGTNFLFAYALDAGNASLQKLFSDMAKISQAMPGMGGMDFASMVASSKGMAGAVGTVPMMGAGLFSNTITLTQSNDAKSVLANMKKLMTDMDGQSIEGMKYAITWEDKASSVAGVDISRYGVAMQPDGTGDGAFGPAAMVLPMLFGPSGGPNGFMAVVDGMIIQTMSQNTPLMEKAIESARTGGGIGSNAALRAVTAKLPENRVLEVYIGIDQIMNTAGPMAATFGVLPAFEPMPAMAPIGMGMSMGNNGMQTSIHMPLDVIKGVMKIANDMQNTGFDEEPAAGGRPRF